MKYLSFTIKKYRAIENDLVVNLEKNKLLPIIGINECGKTTILHAIFSFDFYNDSFNDVIHHLDDVKNLYKPGQKEDPKIEALVQLDWNDFLEILNSDNIKSLAGVSSYKRKKTQFKDRIIISRNLNTKLYDIESDIFSEKNTNNLIAKEIIRQLPYILFFDDFRDSFPDQIEIKDEEKGKGWLAIIERLFKKTDENFSVFALKDVEERERNSIKSQVQKKLNQTLTEEWKNFNLNDGKALKINIDYKAPTVESGVIRPAVIKFDILETDEKGNDHFFYIRDRSKGFFWFFNFVMKLEFNPKIISSEDVDAIYLLDEPGSYLHAGAQRKLCSKLKELSENNAVIFCTHSHYLLDPEVIPISSIRIAQKVKDFKVELTSIYEVETDIVSRNAFQPIYDALQLKPMTLDFSDKAILVEGIYDFYCFNMFTEKKYKYIPSQNAESILYYISLFIGWHIKFNALWDNDPEGVNAYNKALEKFGDEFKNKFHKLPLKNQSSKSILQDFIDGSELNLIKKELGLPMNSSFQKTIATLFYNDKKDEILIQTPKTSSNFKEIQESFVF